MGLWAKKNPDGSYHPLPWHLLDVAAVALCLWRDCLGEGLRNLLCTGMNLSPTQGGPWIAFLAGLHDLGKAIPDFQFRPGMPPGCENRLRSLGLGPDPAPEPLRHTIATECILLDHDLLAAQLNIDSDTARVFSHLLGAHHGIFSTGHACENASRRLRQIFRRQPGWKAVQLDLFLLLKNTVLSSGTRLPVVQPDDNVTPLLLAGLVCLADWIGSDESLFPYRTKEINSDLYWEESLSLADAALKTLGWSRWTRTKRDIPFSGLFPWPPRPIQERVEQLVSETDKPVFAVLEVPMGEGKTEAAIRLFEHWLHAHRQRGLYFALPTSATSNQMFGRMKEFLERRFEEQSSELQLLHSHRFLSDAFSEIKIDSVAVDENGLAGGVVAHAWFAGRKRGLLATHAVGTVDQALLSVLQTRHGFLRLFGLAGKTLIFDEVHAYDAYMLTLFIRLLEWLGKMGTTVAVLSATLPRKRLGALLEAYSGKSMENELAPYPRITWVDQAGVCHGESLTVSERSRYHLNLEWVSSDAGQMAERLRDSLAEGGCVAWICNTVRYAQEVYLRLRSILQNSCIHLDLFHSRFPQKHRQKIEERILAEYGPHRKSGRPRILVATQVIEQSLDLDFDLMISEMAPVDLILQRAGRLHRHALNRSSALAKRRLLIVEPEGHAVGLPQFGPSAHVYERFILLRSWLALRNRQEILIPEQVEDLIEQVYGDGLLEVPENLISIMAEAREKFKRDCESREMKGRLVTLPNPEDEDALWQWSRDLEDDEDPSLHPALIAQTRLSNPSVTGVCLHCVNGRLCFDPVGGEEYRPDVPPASATVRKLLESSVSLSYWGCTTDIPCEDTPAFWKQHALLRHCRLLIFRESVMDTASKRLILDSDLGIKYETWEENLE